MNHPNLPLFTAGVNRFGQGIEVYTVPFTLPDGKMLLSGTRLFVGMGPLSELEQIRRDARQHVRMLYHRAGILDWLGEPLDRESGRSILNQLRSGTLVP